MVYYVGLLAGVNDPEVIFPRPGVIPHPGVPMVNYVGLLAGVNDPVVLPFPPWTDSSP